MNKKVKFYTIAIVNRGGELTNIDITEFLNNIEDLFLANRIAMPREAYHKDVYMFTYTRESNEEFVIPFGTLKQNTPYLSSPANPKEITPAIMLRLFDVNLLYYNSRENLVAITCDKGAPNNKVIAAFLSGLINSEDYMVEINPILYETGIEVIRNSRYVKSVTLTINLDKNIQAYYNNNIRKEGIMSRQLLNLMYSSKNDIGSSTFKLTLGLGHSKRDTMNKEHVLSLLDSLDLTSEVIKEVSLNFVDGETENIQPAKLKNHDLELNEMLPHEGKGSLLAGEMIDGMSRAIEKNRRLINTKIRNFNNGKVQVNDTIEIITGDIDGRIQEEVLV